MTFSATGAGTKNVNILKRNIGLIIEKEGFTVHPDKTRIMRKGSRKEVTGLVVNDKPGIERKTLRRFRALLFQLQTEGLAGKKWGNSPDVLSAIEGYANFVYMVDPVKGAKLQSQVKEIIHKLAPDRPKRSRKQYPKKAVTQAKSPFIAEVPVSPVQSPTLSDAAKSTTDNSSAEPKKAWWKLWKK
jgi:hypothetical protein